MPQWTAFAVLTGVVLVVLLVLTHLTQAAFPDGSNTAGADDRSERNPKTHAESEREEPPSEPSRSGSQSPEPIDRPRPGNDNSVSSVDRSQSSTEPEPTGASYPDTDRDTPFQPADRDTPARPTDSAGPPEREFDPESLSTAALLANVAASQGVFAVVLIGAAVYFAIPAGAFGIDVSWSSVRTGVVWGTAFGIALYIANEIAAATATWLGFDHDERLRELLAPDSVAGWALLLGVVLPIIAVFEELLFRAALIGVLSTGFAIDPWLLAIGSSIAFALGHGMQGGVGIVVTGLLGFVLAAGFILTGSFLVVVVAHYWINALEFVVHEGLGFEWTEAIERG